jgi:hypothetical protein
MLSRPVRVNKRQGAITRQGGNVSAEFCHKARVMAKTRRINPREQRSAISGRKT